jgi:dephospho-CoA kinase
LVVAVTGGIGSGKTRVSDRLAVLGATVIDADRIAHALTAPGGEAMSAIANAFGQGMLTTEGELDRPSLRRLVFRDPDARHRLEAILHPRIRRRMLEQLSRAAGAYAVLVIPLLFETGQTDIADRILVVDAPEPLQVARLKARNGMDEEEIRRIMATQVQREVRLAGADDLIDNSGTVDALDAQIDALHRYYVTLARSGKPRQPPS